MTRKETDMKYTEEHEWLRADGDVYIVGITEHATTQLGDLVFVELPEVGSTVTKDDEIVVIESVKAASDILAPLDGEIVEVNGALTESPSMINEDAMGAAWFFKMKVSDMSALDRLAATIEARKGADPETSWTAKLLDKGPEKCAEKFGEEAVEAIIEAVKNDKAKLTAEAADVLYHLLVMLASRDVTLRDVEAELARREGISGIAEKAARPDS